MSPNPTVPSLAPWDSLLSTLSLHESIVLPGGEVTRVTLFGFAIAGEVLDREEAASRACTPAGPLTFTTTAEVVFLDEEPEELEDDGSACSGPCEDGRPCLACVEALEAETDALMVEMGYGEWDLTDAAPAALEDEPAPLPPAPEPVAAPPALPEAVAKLCPACDGGRRRRCMRCDGRCVRLWVGKFEIARRAPATDMERLAGACALSALLPEILGNAHAMKGAQELLHVCLTGCSPVTRELALASWMRALA